MLNVMEPIYLKVWKTVIRSIIIVELGQNNGRRDGAGCFYYTRPHPICGHVIKASAAPSLLPLFRLSSTIVILRITVFQTSKLHQNH